MVADFVQAKMSPADLPPIDAHLDGCADCWQLVAALAGTMLDSETGHAAEPAPVVGRYVLDEVLGQGAMGIVYSAHDPMLDRKIAIKLLHPEAAGSRRDSRQERFLREAKAMARLVHPNVVAVHDTGTTADQVFVAMEYVNGMHLRAWLSEEPREIAVIIDAFVQAGTGLAAAHGAGIVHRDFKPDNVFVAKDGTVKVGDFGLVAFAETEEPDLLEIESPLLDESEDRLRTLTQTGTRLGTALYMSPEQFDATLVGPASDQFSFCVALYEALYGTPPFPGRSGQKIREAIEAQKIDRPTGTQVPAWMHQILLRGLKKEPTQRHASMEHLVKALRRSTHRSRKRWFVGAGLLAAASAMFLAWPGQERDQLCSLPTDSLTGVWDDAQRTRLQTEFSRSPNPRAQASSDRVTSALDVYADDWLKMRVETCEATHVTGHQSEHLLDLRVHCLDRKLAGFGALVESFVSEAATSSFADLAPSALAKVPSIRDCIDTEALLEAVERPTDRETAQKLSELESKLDKAIALETVGKFAEALRLAEAVASDAKPLHYPPLYTAALYEVALLQYELAQYKASETSAALIVQVASANADDERVTDAWLLLENLAVKQSNYEEAIRLKPWTEAAILRSGDLPRQRMKLLMLLGTVHLRKGRHAEAEGNYLFALALAESLDEPSPASVSAIHLNLGIAAFTQGKMDAADRHLARALTLQEETLGPKHPGLARVLLSICSAQHTSARYDEAEQACLRSLRIREQSLGLKHPDLTHPLNLLADLARKKKDLVKARSLYERSLTIAEDALEPMHPDLASVLTNFGDLLRELGEYDEAAEYLGRSLEIKQKSLGAKHPYVGIALHNLGNLAFETKDYALALDYQKQARVLLEGLGKEHSYVSFALSAIGEIQIASGKARLAITPLQQALSIRSGPGNDPVGRAQTQFLLAKARFLSASGTKEKVEALELARGAEESFQAIGDKASEDLQEVRAWLKTRRSAS